MEKEPNSTAEQAEELAPDVLVNGLTDPQNYDYYRIAAKNGQRYIVDCAALRIDSRAQVVLTLLDGSGAEVQSSRATKDRDPMIDFTASEDGPVLLGADAAKARARWTILATIAVPMATMTWPAMAGS